MKKLFQFLAATLALFSVSIAQASDMITATVTVTAAPANNDTLTVNGTTRTWKTSVTVPSTQIAVGANIGASKTNLFNQITAYTFTGPLTIGQSSTNVVTLRGQPAQSMTVSASGSWATITYATNTVTDTYAVRVPITSEPTATQRTNIASLLLTSIGDYATNSFTKTTAFQHFVDTASAQTLSNKTISSVGTQISGKLTNVTIRSAFLTSYTTNSIGPSGYNGIYFNDVLGAQYYLISPDSSGRASLYDASVTNYPTTPAQFAPDPANLLNVLIASNTFGGKSYANSWTGTNEFTRITNSTIVGSALQYASQISGTITSITNGYWLSGGLTNASSTNTTLYLTNKVSGQWGYKRVNNTTIASGNNAAVDFGDTAFAKITSSPGANFTLCGIANGWDGRRLIVVNATGWTMSIANNSGVDPSPSNRIYTPGGLTITTATPGMAEFIYDSEDSKWILVNYR